MSPGVVDPQRHRGLAGIGYDEIAKGVSIRPGLPILRPRGNSPTKTRSRSSPVRSGRRLFLTAATASKKWHSSMPLNQLFIRPIPQQPQGVLVVPNSPVANRSGADTKTGTWDGGDQQHRIPRQRPQLRLPTGPAGGTLVFTAGANAGLQTDRNQTPRTDGTFEVFRVIPLSRGGWGRLRGNSRLPETFGRLPGQME